MRHWCVTGKRCSSVKIAVLKLTLCEQCVYPSKYRRLYVRNQILKSTYHSFNIENSTKFSPEVSTWHSFLAFRKFSLPVLYESILTC